MGIYVFFCKVALFQKLTLQRRPKKASTFFLVVFSIFLSICILSQLTLKKFMCMSKSLKSTCSSQKRLFLDQFCKISWRLFLKWGMGLSHGFINDSGSEFEFIKKFSSLILVSKWKRFVILSLQPVFILSAKGVLEQRTSITNPSRSSNPEIWQMFFPFFLLQFSSRALTFHFQFSCLETYNGLLFFHCQIEIPFLSPLSLSFGQCPNERGYKDNGASLQYLRFIISDVIFLLMLL